jgi:drug/metabolite transporter (DMT)-like permease
MRTVTPAPIVRRRTGIMLAGITAFVSGVAVFVNGYGVRRFDDATTYTTAKNLVAGLALASGAIIARQRTRDGAQTASRLSTPPVAAVVAVIGGSVPFVLFFEGLRRVDSTEAAFIHKTMLAWVAVLAVVLLGERLTPIHVTAVFVILVGQADLTGGVGWPRLGTGELMILAATWCWSAEVIVSRILLRSVPPLRLGTIRMLGGSAMLLAWAFARGAATELLGLGIGQWGWALLTGGILTVYVATWHHALARAPAVDVSAVLVLGAVITALLSGAVRGASLEPISGGLILTTVGAGLVALAGWQNRAATGAST